MNTAEVEPMTAAEARRITERIRSALDRFSTSWADLAERVTEAYDRRADLALGYGSWADYATAEFHPAEGLAASVRQQIVGLLTAQGMSTRAIAPVAGVSFQQVAKITSKHVSPDATPAGFVPEVIDFATGEVLADQRGGTKPPPDSPDVEAQDVPGQPPAPRGGAHRPRRLRRDLAALPGDVRLNG